MGQRIALLSALALVLCFDTAAAQPCSDPPSQVFERLSPSVVSIQGVKINKAKPQRRFGTGGGPGGGVGRDGQGPAKPPLVRGMTSPRGPPPGRGQAGRGL